MPLTLSEADYIYLMTQKGIEESESKSHYERMKGFSNKFDKGDMGLFGAVDVGKDACWWDYGQLKLYSKNTNLLLDDSNPECVLLRKFLGLTEGPTFGKIQDSEADLVHSFAFNSKIKSGIVKDSIACQVSTNELNAEGAILVNCVAPKITAGKGCILYNIMSEVEIKAQDGQVMVAVTNEKGESFVLKSRVDIDGGNAWKKTVEGNESSFEQVWKNNKMTDISKIDKERAEKYTTLSSKM
jgi:PHD/YefM family antitoxin component YafN of YafNO toxin-antitoxin module